jgi:hypothetical protein
VEKDGFVSTPTHVEWQGAQRKGKTVKAGYEQNPTVAA